MKMKNIRWTFPFVLLSFVSVLTTGCQKEEEKEEDEPENTVTDIDGNVYNTKK
jgi:hypothetical protein